jgi:hypothetical protein
MELTIIRGRTATVECTVYSLWTGQASSSIPANITGGTVKAYIKVRDGDADADALATINASLTTPLFGVCRVTIPAATSNAWSFQKVVIEVVAKTAGGEYIGNGVNDLVIKPNVGKTLF